MLIKQIPDLGTLSIDPVTREAALGSELVMNTYDIYGLSTGLDLRERFGGTVTAIAAGGAEVREVLLRALATGADDAVQIDLPSDNGGDSLATAHAIAAQVRAMNLDVVLAGQSTEDIETGQVGPQVAELLHWPHVSLVNQVDVEGSELRVTRDAEGAKEVLGVPMPAVLMVLSGREGTQRFPTLRGMMAAKKKDIPVHAAETDGQSLRLTWTDPLEIEREKTGVVLEGVPAADAAAQLVAWLKEQKLV